MGLPNLGKFSRQVRQSDYHEVFGVALFGRFFEID
jgi:hypothetical protein